MPHYGGCYVKFFPHFSFLLLPSEEGAAGTGRGVKARPQWTWLNVYRQLLQGLYMK